VTIGNAREFSLPNTPAQAISPQHFEGTSVIAASRIGLLNGNEMTDAETVNEGERYRNGQPQTSPGQGRNRLILLDPI
jgi:hypothetical protein